MDYALEGKPADYGLPDPVPGNMVKHHQILKWMAGLLPGGLLLYWLWGKWDNQEEIVE